MEEASFGERLHDLFPHLSEKGAMESLLRKYGTYRAMAQAKEVGAGLATISRWGRRLGVTQPPSFPHFRVIRALLTVDGDTMEERLARLKQEEGTWLRVAVRLGVAERELKYYRYSIGVVPRDKWEVRKDERRKSGGETDYWTW